eukprot:1158856-Pelagomonas_calceolata.AAC.7
MHINKGAHSQPSSSVSKWQTVSPFHTQVMMAKWTVKQPGAHCQARLKMAACALVSLEGQCLQPSTLWSAAVKQAQLAGSVEAVMLSSCCKAES